MPVSSDKKIKILLIGPVTNLLANLVGGATISFGYLTDFAKREGLLYALINTQRWPRGFKRYFNIFYILFRLLIDAPGADVLFLNSSRGGTKYLAPLLYVMAKLFRKKFVFRPFGGDMKDYTAHYSSLQKWIFQKTVLQADLLFLQSKELMQYYAGQAAHTIQLPTSRATPPSSLLTPHKVYQKRLAFLGNIQTSKGIDHLLEAAQQLGETYTLHLYGPLVDSKYLTQLAMPHPHYKGILSKDKILTTLSQYDLLLLPTYYEGEGYPGVIIEAYSLGLPVIATRWKAIPEIVKEGESGQLIPPHSTEALVEAIRSFTPQNYSHFSQAARQYFLNEFDAAKVNHEVLEAIRALY